MRLLSRLGCASRCARGKNSAATTEVGGCFRNAKHPPIRGSTRSIPRTASGLFELYGSSIRARAPKSVTRSRGETYEPNLKPSPLCISASRKLSGRSGSSVQSDTCETAILQAHERRVIVIVYAVVDAALSPDFLSVIRLKCSSDARRRSGTSRRSEARNRRSRRSSGSRSGSSTASAG